ncbi:MAG: hypothetical protein ABIH23_19525 [bacterium]
MIHYLEIKIEPWVHDTGGGGRAVVFRARAVVNGIEHTTREVIPEVMLESRWDRLWLFAREKIDRMIADEARRTKADKKGRRKDGK